LIKCNTITFQYRSRCVRATEADYSQLEVPASTVPAHSCP
jgi:hypothetical protein